MRRLNKAHTATLNRIARRYGVELKQDSCDLHTPQGLIGVETAATVARRARKLKSYTGRAYIAVTNREALSDALRATEGSGIGVMDPQGNIVKVAEPHKGSHVNGASNTPSDLPAVKS
jgi:hypothetical protein